MWSHSKLKQHCTTTARLRSSDLCSLCPLTCCLWFTHTIITHFGYCWRGSGFRLLQQLFQLCLCIPNWQCWCWNWCSPGVCACWHQTLSTQGWTGCWKELLAQAWMECHFVHTHFQIWIFQMLSLFLPSYMNSSYLHLSRWHQRLLEKTTSHGSREDKQSTITVLGQEVEEFVYLINSNSSDISQRNAITRVAMQIWKSRSSICTKLKLHSTHFFLYGFWVLGSYQERCRQD